MVATYGDDGTAVPAREATDESPRSAENDAPPPAHRSLGPNVKLQLLHPETNNSAVWAKKGVGLGTETESRGPARPKDRKRHNPTKKQPAISGFGIARAESQV